MTKDVSVEMVAKERASVSSIETFSGETKEGSVYGFQRAVASANDDHEAAGKSHSLAIAAVGTQPRGKLYLRPPLAKQQQRRAKIECM